MSVARLAALGGGRRTILGRVAAREFASGKLQGNGVKRHCQLTAHVILYIQNNMSNTV
jgi:hypothetical protein